MERRDFLSRGVAVVVGAGLASGVASGIAEVTSPALRSVAAGGKGRVKVLEGRVASIRGDGSRGGPSVGTVTVRLEVSGRDEPVEVRFRNLRGSRYLGPHFDLDLLRSRLDRGDTVRIVVHGRDGPYDALKVL